MESMLRNTVICFAVVFAVAAGAAAESQPFLSRIGVDCSAAKCPELTVLEDSYATLPNGKPSPFRGFADAVLRQDPTVNDKIHLAYSWPHLESVTASSKPHRGGRKGRGFTPSVETHYAVSEDGGRSFKFVEVLWRPQPATDPNTGAHGHIAVETPNILPVERNGDVIWYGARLEYFLPNKGAYKDRPLNSFRIAVMEGPSPTSFDERQAAHLGAAVTDAAWADLDLTELAAQTRRCTIWNEPALAYDNGELFLALSCQAFSKKGPVMEQNKLVLFATRPNGAPRDWVWRFAGTLAGASEAHELGGERLTQIELAKGQTGEWLAIMTPDNWDAKSKDFVHLGCVVVAIESLTDARLSRTESGVLDIRASLSPRADGGGDTGACAYDRNSATGLLIGWRMKEGANASSGGGRQSTLTMSQKITALHP